MLEAVFVSLAATLFLPACGLDGTQRDSPPRETESTPPQLPSNFLGRWNFAGTSGGIDGGGDPRRNSAGSGSIEIRPNRIDYFDASGAKTTSRPFACKRGPSIYSNEEGWLLDDGSGFERVIAVHGDQLVISDNVYDGYSAAYVRPADRSGL